MPMLPEYQTPAATRSRSIYRRLGIWIGIALAAAGIGLAALIAVVIYVAHVMLVFDVTFVVENDTTAAVPVVQFVFGGNTYSVLNIPPGATLGTRVSLEGSGPATYHITMPDGSTLKGEAVNHLDEDCQGDRIGIRLKDGVVTRF